MSVFSEVCAVKRPELAAIALLFALIPPAFSQHKVDLRNTHERIYAIVPMIGAGTPQDPRRPLYAPLPGAEPAQDAIVAFSYQLSDDGKTALVEFVARDRAAFTEILRDKDRRHDVKFFDKGKSDKRDVNAEFRKHKKDFDFDRFGVAVP